MEKRGIYTERGSQNREIIFTNQQLRQLRARVGKLNNWLNEEAVVTSPPALYEVIQNILQRDKSNTHYQRIANLKQAANILIFIRENDMKDMADLQDKVKSMYSKTQEMRDKLKPVERRLKTLNEHIQQAAYYKEFKSIYQSYLKQKPKKQDDFREAHRREITLYEAAKKYLDTHLNGHDIPTKSWKSEWIKLSVEKDNLYREYYALKEETRQVEVIKKSVENILRENGYEPQRTFSKDTER
jgi:hypothetical protein